jgi:threonine/homoserine/homoserine lactone efflux protein
VRSAVRGGRREALLVTVGNSVGLAVFFVALFPQFVPDGARVLPSALAMAGMVVALGLRLAFERR